MLQCCIVTGLRHLHAGGNTAKASMLPKPSIQEAVRKQHKPLLYCLPATSLSETPLPLAVAASPTFTIGSWP